MNETPSAPAIPAQPSDLKPQPSLYDRTKITRNGITIYKRYDGVDAPYYFRPSAQGRRLTRKLLRTAEDSFKKARAILDAIDAGRFDALEQTKQRRQIVATVKTLCDTYKKTSGDASANTRTQNIHGLNLILRAVYGSSGRGNETGATEFDPQLLEIQKISADCGRKWFQIQTQKVLAEPDQNKQLSIKRSANSRFAQARSLFTARALVEYKSAGIWHECLEQFAQTFNTHKFGRLPGSEYNAPSDETIQRTIADWQTLGDHQRDLFLAIGHELAFGLRKGELAQAKWKWWTTREGYPVLDGQANVKSGAGNIQVRALDPYFTIMSDRVRACGWDLHHERTGRAGDDYIISGNQSNREQSIFKAVGEFLRRHGWETKKTNHALRAYSGSQIAMRYGIYEAQTWLRHSTVKVTENHYAHFVKRFRPANIESIGAKWATVQTDQPQLRVLPAIA